MKLDRLGDEVARATSLVRYKAGCSFPKHVHGGGEEIFVLSGTFADEFGEYPQGSYIRNPIGSEHAPRVREETLIFVKLYQFQTQDTLQCVIDTANTDWQFEEKQQYFYQTLHRFKNEPVALVKIAANRQLPNFETSGGMECLIIQGGLYSGTYHHPRMTWIRLLKQAGHRFFTKNEGATLYLKTGHLNTLCH